MPKCGVYDRSESIEKKEHSSFHDFLKLFVNKVYLFKDLKDS